MKLLPVVRRVILNPNPRLVELPRLRFINKKKNNQSFEIEVFYYIFVADQAFAMVME